MAFDTSDTLNRSDLSDELLPGTALFHGQYRIVRYINSGGFGITYLAKDSLDREVVIKECFSSTFCRRTETRVRARSLSTRDNMQRIVKSFLNEARSLASLKHPNVVGVHQVFEDNDTAYMAMDYIRGHDLLEIVDEKKATLPPDQIVTIAGKLVSAIGYIHGRGLLHCDISPDNIFVTPDGEPILIDFGAARRSAAGEAQKYSGLSVVKDGYSPHELYAAGGNSGPWSDIYSLAASLYHAISGTAPENCQSRLSAMAEKRPDPCRPLAGRITGYPAGFLDSIDRAMAVVPAARFQKAEDWQRILPQPEAKDRKVVLLRRLVPMTPAAEGPVRAVVPEARPAPLPVRPRRTFLRGNEVDISGLRRVSGFVGAWLVDSVTGHVLAAEQDEGPHDHESVMAAAVGLGRAHLRAMELVDDSVEDILVTLGRSVLLIRPLPQSPKAFLCVTMDGETANPGLARVQLRRVAQSVRL
ncbi:MAG: serine/threonine-protein kinase [Tabrizicola sp.]|uniref:serine/threonine-protein kinase n=1 Tax=Tabrizicola sp. TaxID=2005166 RepID=UPI002AB8C1C2|nr:serine/threonine-protein kinase [Tabrizicola sp.]MDZ4088661.1 serine/threonine-protein kinase [Tabrizicola sp.]